MSGSGLALAFAVPIVIAAAFVAAMAVSRWALASVARAQAEAEARDDAGVSMVPFGELPEPQVRAVMATRRRALVVGGSDIEGEK